MDTLLCAFCGEGMGQADEELKTERARLKYPLTIPP